MTTFKRFMWRGLAALFLLVLLIGGGVALHLMGWSQGYQAAHVAAEGEGVVSAPPYMPEGWRPVGWMPFGYGFGGLVRVFLLLLFFGLLAKVFFSLFRFLVWGTVGGPMMIGRHWSRSWAGHRRWPHYHARGPVPPWAHWCGPWGWNWDAADQETPGGEPGTESDDN